MNRLLIFWRTMIVLLLLAGFLLAGLVFCLHWPNGVGLFSSYSTGIGALAAFAVGKSMVEHLSNSSGVSGAASALVSGKSPGSFSSAPSEAPKVIP